jgi:hypothetical protein
VGLDKTKKTQKNIAIPNKVIEDIENERSVIRPIPSFSEFGAELIERGLKVYKEENKRTKGTL